MIILPMFRLCAALSDWRIPTCCENPSRIDSSPNPHCVSPSARTSKICGCVYLAPGDLPSRPGKTTPKCPNPTLAGCPGATNSVQVASGNPLTIQKNTDKRPGIPSKRQRNGRKLTTNHYLNRIHRRFS